MGINKVVEKFCIQTAVYWGSPVKNGFGNSTYADPVEIKVRWDDIVSIIKDRLGKEIQVEAAILSPSDLEYSGQLFLGTLADLLLLVTSLGIDLDSGETYPQPKQIETAYEIVGFNKINMPMSITQTVRTYYLKYTIR